MNDILKTEIDAISERDEYSREEYESIRQKLEEVSYEDSWNESPAILELLDKLTYSEKDDNIFKKLFKGLILLLLS